MKRLMLLALVALSVLGMALPSHAADFVATGTILIPSPESRVIGGLTEQISPCTGSIDPDVPDGTAQGLDAFWVALPEGTQGRPATLTSTSPNDVDAWFYDDGCNLILPSADPNAYSMATTDPAPNGDEAGTIPEFAAFVAIDLYLGVAAPFTFTVSIPTPE